MKTTRSNSLFSFRTPSSRLNSLSPYFSGMFLLKIIILTRDLNDDMCICLCFIVLDFLFNLAHFVFFKLGFVVPDNFPLRVFLDVLVFFSLCLSVDSLMVVIGVYQNFKNPFYGSLKFNSSVAYCN